MGSELRRVVDIERQQETAGDSGRLLLRALRASKHGQETLNATGSKRRHEEVMGRRSSILPNH